MTVPTLLRPAVLGICVLAFGALARAQAQAHDLRWDDLVRELRPERELMLELTDGGLRWGRAVTIDDSSLVLGTPARAFDSRFARDEIRFVKLRTGSGQDTAMIVGGLAGAVVLGALPPVAGEEFSFAGTLLGATLGAGIGALIGAGIRTYDTYDARTERRASLDGGP